MALGRGLLLEWEPLEREALEREPLEREALEREPLEWELLRALPELELERGGGLDRAEVPV